jgi:hypothetical protein
MLRMPEVTDGWPQVVLALRKAAEDNCSLAQAFENWRKCHAISSTSHCRCWRVSEGDADLVLSSTVRI